MKKTLQILGTGCPKCRKLAENAEAAARSLGIEFELVKVTEIDEIIAYGAMMTPGLAVDGELKCSGKVLSADEIRSLLAAGEGEE